MKKIYIQPSMKVYVVKAAEILAGSDIPNAVSVHGEKGNGTQLGKFFDDDDDWDE